jgi:excisionase family DNA binding protein
LGEELKEFLSSRDVKDLLGISRSKAAQICSNELPSYRLGKLVRVKRTDLETYLAAHKHEPTEESSSSKR